MTDHPDARSAGSRSFLVPVFGVVALVLLAIALFSGSSDPQAAGNDTGNDADEATDPVGDQPGGTAPDDGPSGSEATEDDEAGGSASDEAGEVAGGDAGEAPGASTGEPSAEEIAEMQAALRELERREEGDPLALGAVDAPVVMILWSDFQCSFCATFARDIKPALEDRYVDDGTLRIEWRDYPLLGDSSVAAALAGRAAAEQGAFWELHDEIYAEDRARDSLDADVLTTMAGDLGLDTERFAAHLDDEDVWTAVASDQALANQLGITGTPAFLVNGTPVLGAQSEDFFIQLIEDLAQQS